MSNLLTPLHCGENFIYYFEEGDTLAGVSAKLKTPLERLIKDNCLTCEPKVGSALYVSKAFCGKVLLPEDFKTGQNDGEYPFKVV